MVDRTARHKATLREQLAINEYMKDKILNIEKDLYNYVEPYNDQLIANELNLLHDNDLLTANMVMYVRLKMYGRLIRSHADVGGGRLPSRFVRDVKMLKAAIDCIIYWADRGESTRCSLLADALRNVKTSPQFSDPPEKAPD